VAAIVRVRPPSAVVPPPGIADALAVGERKPNIEVVSRGNPGETFFCYADDGEGNAVQLNRAADHITGAPECALPVAIIEDGDRCCGWRVIARLEYPA